MKEEPGQSIWNSELEPLAIVIYRAIHPTGTDDTWAQEPTFVQAAYLDAALAARNHLTTS